MKVCLAGATGWAGSELAIRRVSALVGEHRGLDAVLDL
jgi:hypothetical protein